MLSNMQPKQGEEAEAAAAQQALKWNNFAIATTPTILYGPSPQPPSAYYFVRVLLLLSFLGAGNKLSAH